MEELINKAKDGDIEAYTEAFMLVRKELKGIAVSKISDRNYVEDIIQDVYFKAYKKLDTLADSRSFRKWISTMMKNECRNYNKRASHHVEVDVDEYDEVLEDSSAL